MDADAFRAEIYELVLPVDLAGVRKIILGHQLQGLFRSVRNHVADHNCYFRVVLLPILMVECFQHLKINEPLF